MFLTSKIKLVGYESLDELAAIALPVAPAQPDQRAFIDVSVGLREIEVLADTELTGWRQITCQDTRFEIAQDVTGQQLASAFKDSRVIDAIEHVISPPSLPIGRVMAQKANMTGSESFNQCVNELIDALSVHLQVYRPKIFTGACEERLITQPELF